MSPSESRGNRDTSLVFDSMTKGSFKCYPHVYFLTHGVISCLLGTNVVVVLPPVYTRNNF